MDHTGVRPHPCPQCKLTFKTSNSLKKHKLSVHSDIKHFACQFCGSRFSTSSGVLRHQKKQRCSALNRSGEGVAVGEAVAGDAVRLLKQEGEAAWKELALARVEGAREPQLNYRLHLQD